MKKLMIILAAAVIAGSILLACGGTSSRNDAALNMTAHNMSNMENHDMANMSGHDMSKMDEMTSAPDANEQPYDLQFIDTMILHHQGAIKMANMVIGKTERAELKKFGQTIIDDQTKEIDQLKTWRDEWFPGKPSAMNMDMPGMVNQGIKTMDSEHMKSMDEMEPAHF